MSDFKDNPKLRNVYLAILDNMKATWEKTGKVGGVSYKYWDKYQQGCGINKAHIIANEIIKRKHPEYFTPTNKKSNKDLIDDLDYFYKKAREIELKKSFEHPDYKHVHSKEY